MPARKWTAREARPLNLVDAPGFNTEYDQLKGTLSGGLDRTSTPSDWVDRDYIRDEAFHSVVLTKNVELSSDFRVTGNSGYMFDSVSYSNFTGGWQQNTLVQTSGWREGMVHLELSFFHWFNPTATWANAKGTKYRLSWNGNCVAETGYFYQPWANPYICCDFPVAGDGTLSLEWTYPSPYPDYDSAGDIPQMYFGSGQLLLIPRWR